MEKLEKLTTETRNMKTINIDRLSIIESLRLMNEEDKKVAIAIEKVLPEIQKIIDAVILAFNNDGRLLYIGAGTSGRLGILDAVECVPTFGTEDTMVQGLIAGGNDAIWKAVEGAEDSESLGMKDLKEINLSKNDVLIGLAASGRTPYVIGALQYAKSIGATTASITCNKESLISNYSEIPVEVELGPEFLTGSTRLKSGTAQKMILNMISTISMIGIGKVYKNLMVDVKPTNLKLIERAKRIIMDATGCDYKTAESTYYLAKENVKVAIIMIIVSCSREEAVKRLENAHYFVGNALHEREIQND